MAKQFGYGSRFGGRFSGRNAHNEETSKTVEVTEDMFDGAVAASANNKIELPGVKAGEKVLSGLPARFIVDAQGERIHALVRLQLPDGRLMNINCPINGVPVLKNGEYSVSCEAEYIITVLSERPYFSVNKAEALDNGDLKVTVEKSTFVRAVPTKEWAKNGVETVETTVKTVLERAGDKPEKASK